MEINYEVTKNSTENKAVYIESEEFISIAHKENGITMWTAFIGNGVGNRKKKSIKISPCGGILEIREMFGSAELNAIRLLSKDDGNKVIPNEDFIFLYETQKPRLVIDL